MGRPDIILNSVLKKLGMFVCVFGYLFLVCVQYVCVWGEEVHVRVDEFVCISVCMCMCGHVCVELWKSLGACVCVYTCERGKHSRMKRSRDSRHTPSYHC